MNVCMRELRFEVGVKPSTPQPRCNQVDGALTLQRECVLSSVGVLRSKSHTETPPRNERALLTC